MLGRTAFKACKIPLLKTRDCKVAAIVGLIFTPSIVQLIRYNYIVKLNSRQKQAEFMHKIN